MPPHTASIHAAKRVNPAASRPKSREPTSRRVPTTRTTQQEAVDFRRSPIYILTRQNVA